MEDNKTPYTFSYLIIMTVSLGNIYEKLLCFYVEVK